MPRNTATPDSQVPLNAPLVTRTWTMAGSSRRAETLRQRFTTDQVEAAGDGGAADVADAVGDPGQRAGFEFQQVEAAAAFLHVDPVVDLDPGAPAAHPDHLAAVAGDRGVEQGHDRAGLSLPDRADDAHLGPVLAGDGGRHDAALVG